MEVILQREGECRGGLLTQGRFNWDLDHSTCFSETSLGALADKAGRGWLGVRCVGWKV